MSLSSKRHRTASASSSSSATILASGPAAYPPTKSSRTTPTRESEPTSAHPLLCTLPPTCNHRPTPLASTKDLEAHYAKYHAHVCEQRGCGTVFPDARLLELHQTECHDPIAALRKDRGEKIFACHLATCPRLFLTPKARRLHLIQAHGYPKEYFFAVTNKGVGGLLKKWGDGASMIRGQWKPRTGEDEGVGGGDEPAGKDGDEEDDDDERDEQEMPSSDDQIVYEALPPSPDEKISRHETDLQSDGNAGVDTLTKTMNSLSLVPSAVRFGRGGNRGGFIHPAKEHPGPKSGKSKGGKGRRGRGDDPPSKEKESAFMDVDSAQTQLEENRKSTNSRARGLGRAARGRAGITHNPGRSRGRNIPSALSSRIS